MNGKKNEPKALQPFDGEVPVPCWALRPGGVSALPGASKGVALWLAIRSSNGGKLRPCTASRDTLAATLGVSVRTIGSQLKALRKLDGIYLEFRRPEDRHTGQRRPPVRFAIDPMRWWRERPLVEAQLPGIAEADGLPSRWVQRALALVEKRDQKIGRLAHKISSEIYPTEPRAKSARGAKFACNEVGVGGVGSERLAEGADHEE